MNAHPGDFNIDVDAEQQLIGSIFVSDDAFHAVSAFLTPRRCQRSSRRLTPPRPRSGARRRLRLLTHWV